MITKSARIMFLVISTYALGGCGVALIYAKHPAESEQAYLDTKLLESSYRDLHGNIRSSSKKDCSSTIHGEMRSFSTKSELIESWGIPDRTSNEGDIESLTYRGKLRWSGALVGALVVVLPVYVPLLVPTQRDACTVFIKDGQIEGLLRKARKNSPEYFCGYVMTASPRQKKHLGCPVEFP